VNLIETIVAPFLRFFGLSYPNIKYVFVLMLENRSYDHMLGYLDHQAKHAEDLTKEIKPDNLLQPGVLNYNLDYRANPNPFPRIPVSNAAPSVLEGEDPGHEFLDVLAQLCGPSVTYSPSKPYPSPDNLGFYSQYQTISSARPEEALACFTPEKLPVLSFLARTYALCDRWFSSAPTSTWPNRLFAVAGTSQGLDYTYSGLSAGWAIRFGEFDFDKGHIFSWLDRASLTWRVYYHSLPIVNLLKDIGVVKTKANFIDFNQETFKESFARDLEQKNYPTFTWIEPDYGDVLNSFRGGNSQHPLDGVGGGEGFIKDVYETIRNSRLWNESFLIITYDEHGGFFDHVLPTTAAKPGDEKTKYNLHNFDFGQYGVRVPTILVSPWIKDATISTQVYDHTSILKSLARLFPDKLGFIEGVNARIQNANDFIHVLDRAQRRAENDAPMHTPDPLVDVDFSRREFIPDNAPIPKYAIPFLQLWAGVDRDLRQREDPLFNLPSFVEQVQLIQTIGDARAYILEVEARLKRYRRVGEIEVIGDTLNS
jgi:phospholipase C